MASKAANYGVGIGTGAAAGAATGASIGGPWGALIGGVVGGGAGAIGAAVKNSDEDKQRRKLAELQARERKQLVLQLLGAQARAYGADTGVADVLMEKQGMDRGQAEERRQMALAQQLDPNAFVGMAQAGARAAGTLYKQGQQQQPSMTQPTQIQGIPSYATLQNQGGDYQFNDIDPEKLQRLRGLA